jgi:hypothetical protein
MHVKQRWSARNKHIVAASWSWFFLSAFHSQNFWNLYYEHGKYIRFVVVSVLCPLYHGTYFSYEWADFLSLGRPLKYENKFPFVFQIKFQRHGNVLNNIYIYINTYTHARTRTLTHTHTHTHTHIYEVFAWMLACTCAQWSYHKYIAVT